MTHNATSLLRRQGIAGPRVLVGLIALAVFMTGDGIEAGFLSAYLLDLGHTQGDVALLWAVYGIVVAVAAWLSGALAESWGARRVMLVGAVIWVAFQVVFLATGLAADQLPLMLAAFAVRGLGYPLFAYGFLVWLAQRTPALTLGRAVGWYWLAFALGLGVISSYYAGFVLPVLGEDGTLWTSLAFVAVGAVLAGFAVTGQEEAVSLRSTARGVVTSVSIAVSHPKVGVGGLLRLINTLSFYAFVVYLGPYMTGSIGFSAEQWQVIWGTTLAANVVGNVVAGYLGDVLGRLRVIAWLGGVGCALGVLAFTLVPTWIGPNLGVTIVIGAAYGAALAMYVPLSAVVPLLAPAHTAAAVAILNLGAGLSQFAGPVVAALAGPFGAVATSVVIAVIHLAGVPLTRVLESSGETTDSATLDAPARAAPGAPDASTTTPAPSDATQHRSLL